MRKHTSIIVTSKKLNMQTCYDFVQDASCGGIALFVGTVRNNSNNKLVTSLNFSSYKSMAIKEIENIADKALADFDIFKIATLKEKVPIWKKEYFTDGEVWVNSHP